MFFLCILLVLCILCVLCILRVLCLLCVMCVFGVFGVFSLFHMFCDSFFFHVSYCSFFTIVIFKVCVCEGVGEYCCRMRVTRLQIFGG